MLLRKRNFLTFLVSFFPPKDVIENEVSGRAVKKKRKKERKERQEEGNFSMEKNRLKCYHTVLASRVHPMMVSHVLKENYS